ncbi:MAG: metal ABC transporter permease [Bacteroidales bacterium]|nr:metal ABC transporter permease [Bacteroidales bacterium]MCF8328652.1 metal ABC transporter permease [Bacteroidales bacterium]
MNNLLEFGYLTNSLLAAVFAAISCGLIGTYIVSRRMVFVSGGLTHASFGGIGIGHFFGINPIIGAAVFSVIAALGIEKFSNRRLVRQDSVIAMLWSLGMALGIIFIYITPGYSPNLMSYLFGSILTVSSLDIWFLGILSLVSIIVFSVMYKVILYVSFDEDFARTRNLPVQTVKYLMISLVALAIVFNIRVVGIILVLSLLTVPQSIANLFTNKYQNILIFSVLTGLVGTLSGLAAAWLLNIPSGATIVFVLILMFFLASGVKWLQNHGKKALI